MLRLFRMELVPRELVVGVGGQLQQFVDLGRGCAPQVFSRRHQAELHADGILVLDVQL